MKYVHLFASRLLCFTVCCIYKKLLGIYTPTPSIYCTLNLHIDTNWLNCSN